jgi:hypothetical protein
MVHGGERGIRTLPRPGVSVTCRFYIAIYAKFTTVAMHACTLLHAGRNLTLDFHERLNHLDDLVVGVDHGILQVSADAFLERWCRSSSSYSLMILTIARMASS